MRGETRQAETGALLRSAARESLGELAQRLECPFGRGNLVVTAQVSDALDDLLFEAHDRVAFWEQPDATGSSRKAVGCWPCSADHPARAERCRRRLSRQPSAWICSVSISRPWSASGSARRRATSTGCCDARPTSTSCCCSTRRTHSQASAPTSKRPTTGSQIPTPGSCCRRSRATAVSLCCRRTGRATSTRRSCGGFVTCSTFPVPTEVERLQLWRGLVGQLAGAAEAERLSTDLQRLAAGVEVTGAQIKLAVLTALFASRRDQRDVTAGHLMRGLERELAKEGRPVSSRLRERLTGHITADRVHHRRAVPAAARLEYRSGPRDLGRGRRPGRCRVGGGVAETFRSPRSTCGSRSVPAPTGTRWSTR